MASVLLQRTYISTLLLLLTTAVKLKASEVVGPACPSHPRVCNYLPIDKCAELEVQQDCPIKCGVQDILTVGGSKCVFPFLYYGVEYNACAPGTSQPHPWCATALNDDRTFKTWDVCASPSAACVQELDSTWPKYPAIIYDTATADPVLPKKSESGRNLSFRDGSEVLIACPGTKLTFNGETLGKLQCSGGTLTIDKKVVALADLGCVKAPKENINKGGDCGEGGILYTIGWSITADIFEPQIDVCFLQDKETTSYTYHKVYGKSMDAKTIDPKRPGFKSAKYFDVSMTKAYSQKMQKSLFKTLLGSDEAIDTKKQNYFAKGHLAPDSDFVYGYQQDATYYFLNAVPQWQAFNNGNWKALEFSVRDLAVMHDRDLQVWTGATGVLEMPDKNNNPVEIMLGKSYKKNLIPAPALMWKAVYEKSTDSGVAFVGVNNPYATELTDDLRICQDICDQVSWMDWPRDDWAHGYMYCCSLDDLQKALPPTLALPQRASLLAN